MSPHPSLKPMRFGQRWHKPLQPHIVQDRVVTVIKNHTEPSRCAYGLNMRNQPAGSAFSRYGGSSNIPSAPAASPACANCRAIAVPYPQPATTGTQWFVCSTAAEATAENSSSVREKNSPVPPAANRPAGSYSSSQSICSRYPRSSNAKSSVK